MNNEKWYFISIIVAIIMFGMYEIVELTFDRLEILQKNSQVVISR